MSPLVSTLSTGSSLACGARTGKNVQDYFQNIPAEADHQRLDALEGAMLASGLPVQHLPVQHTFTPGLYCRRIFMPAGTSLTSRVHRTTHQYAVLRGVALVRIPGEPEPVLLQAGHAGVTEAGTRRALLILEDCEWATYHVLSPEEAALQADGLPEADLLALIEARIIGPPTREDGRDLFAEYRERLAAAGLPGVHDGPRELPEGGV